jgi:hypothetical protein
VKRAFRILLALMLGTVSAHAMAEAGNYVAVSCGAEHVSIRSDYVEGAPPQGKPADFNLQNYGQTNECRLKSGDVVRVRFGFDSNPFHDTQHSWVSVWFNRKNWLSHQSVEVGSPNDTRADSIDISADGVKVCRVYGSILGSGDDGDDGKKVAPWCVVSAPSELSKTIDSAEPELLNASSQPRLPPTILVGHNDALCQHLAAVGEGSSSSRAEPVEHLFLNLPDSELIQIRGGVPGKGGEETSVADIENAGSARHVYSYNRSLSAYHTYGAFVVLDEKGYQSYLKTPQSHDDLLRNAEAVWPMDWSGHGDRIEAEKNMDKLVLSLWVPDSDGGKEDLPDDDLSITPFTYDGDVYLLLSAAQDLANAFVIRPHPAGKFDQVCAFSPGQPNF